MDYVLFMQKEVTLQPNVNEVKDCWYASQTQIKELLQKSSEDPNTLVTPWFKLIADHFLFKWWASLNDLSHFENDREIHRMPGIPTQVGTVKKRRHSRGLYIRVFLLAMQKDAAIISISIYLI